MIVMGEFSSRAKANRAIAFLAGEVGAVFDPMRDEYAWERAGEQRVLRLVRGDNWELQVSFYEKEAATV